MIVWKLQKITVRYFITISVNSGSNEKLLRNIKTCTQIPLI